MDNKDIQYEIGKEFKLCSIYELGFAPREGYEFLHWTDADGIIYRDGQTVNFNVEAKSLSAVWLQTIIGDHWIYIITPKAGAAPDNCDLGLDQQPFFLCTTFAISSQDASECITINDYHNLSSVELDPEKTYSLSTTEYVDPLQFVRCKENYDIELTQVKDLMFYSLLSDCWITLPLSGDDVKYVYWNSDYSKTNLSDVSGDYSEQNIQSLIVPKDLLSVDSYTMKDCEKLSSLYFQDKSQTSAIGYDAFGKCEKLSSLNLPDSVKSLKDGAFAKCNDLSTMYANSISSISEYAMQNANDFLSVHSQYGTVPFKQFKLSVEEDWPIVYDYYNDEQIFNDSFYPMDEKTLELNLAAWNDRVR